MLTVIESVPVPPGPVQVRVNVLDATSGEVAVDPPEADTEPIPWSIEHEEACPVTVQVSVEVLPEATVVGLAVSVTTGAPTHVDPPCSVKVPLVQRNVAEPVSGIVESVTDVVLPLEVTPAVPEQLPPPHVTACDVQSVVTVISVHGPQLLFSFNSSITPRLPAFVLSAHARAEYVPAALKV
jgi:hypothetical protein